MALVYAAEIPVILRQSVNNPEKRANVDETKGVSLCLMHGGGLHPELPGGKGWYSRAVAGLSAAVREGESWYRGALKSAEAGLARAEQEVSGKY